MAIPNIEYDFYTNGNLAYVGVQDYVSYAGFTWGFGDWYLGVIAGPATGLIPLPYVYVRF